MDERLTHLDPEGGVRMVDVEDKPATSRTAVARGSVLMRPETLRLISRGEMPKGDVLTLAQIAGIMAAKKTPDLLPLCHPLSLASVSVKVSVNHEESSVDVESQVHVTGKTGAEMEALVAVSTACLAVYDMCKAVDRAMEISRIRLVMKSGGKSGTFLREGEDPV